MGDVLCAGSFFKAIATSLCHAFELALHAGKNWLTLAGRRSVSNATNIVLIFPACDKSCQRVGSHEEVD